MIGRFDDEAPDVRSRRTRFTEEEYFLTRRKAKVANEAGKQSAIDGTGG